MFEDRILRVALVISCLIHGVIFLRIPSFNLLKPVLKEQKMEVRYIKENNELKVAQIRESKPVSRLDPFLKLDSKVSASKNLVPAYFEPNSGTKPVPKISDLPKPNFSSPDVTIIKKKITLPPIDMAKIDNPSYINYYQNVREKIRRSAYQNYSRNETGEVYVSFIISNEGYLKAVRLVEERTNAGSYLREIALKSVKNASPFPDFPKELDYPQLSFNIIISFEID